jgi:outer membrane protein assembly factor BamB
MKARMLGSVVAALIVLLLGGPAGAQSERRLTTTLLPVKEAGAIQNAPTGDQGLLWIQNNPAKDVFLQFDLRRLPPGLREGDFVRCTLRLVARDVTYEPADNPDSGGLVVIVTGQLANDDLTPLARAPEIVSLSTLLNTGSRKNHVALGASDALTKAVYQEYSGDKMISLRLHTVSHKASSLLYSTANVPNPSHLARLVIEYKLGPPGLLESASWSQHQQNPEHTGRSPWIPFRAPTGFTLARMALPMINQVAGGIADYPLIYRGDIYLISKVLDQNHLLSLDVRGTVRWRQAIGPGTVQRSPVISGEGILYVVTENRIAAYDLNQAGKEVAAHALSGKPTSYTDLTQGNDGSVFLALAENDGSYIYGLTAELQPFLKSGPWASGQQKISTITVSPNGRRLFAQIPGSGRIPAGAVVIDVADPSEQRPIELAVRDEKGAIVDKPWEYYHAPIAGPAGDVMVFSDFADQANRGNIWGFTSAGRIWSGAGTALPQPALGVNGRVYYLQDGQLRAHRYDNVAAAEVVSSDANLNTTSNLVMDGADNVYFWDNGYLHGYGPHGQPLFKRLPLTGVQERKDQTREGPQQFIRLMVGPDGTLWANNQNADALFAFKPSYSAADLTLEQNDIRTQTAYRATGKLTVGGVRIDAGTQVLLQAQDGIGFAPGFMVQRGASLEARTGF